jgi:hypothetical protein
MRRIAILVLAACGSGHDATTDAPPIVGDGRPGDGSAVLDAAMLTVDDVQCQTHTFTVVNADGSKTITDTKFGIVDGIDPASAYVIESCDSVSVVTSGGVTTTTVGGPVDPACPVGATCTPSGAAFPSFSHTCSWVRIATFVDSHMLVGCGLKESSFDKTGALSFSFESSFGAIRVHH